MAFEQRVVPVDLRPLHIAKTMVEEPRIAPVAAIGRHIEEGLYVNPPRSGSPDSIPVYYQHGPVSEAGFVGYGSTVPVSDSGYVGLGYANAGVPGVAGWVQRIPSPVGAPGINTPAGFSCFTYGNVNRGNGSDQASDEGGDDSNSGKKVKFLCSFGGKILPRPSDGALRYVGGHTRIISVRRDVSFEELIQKMAEAYGQNVAIKYQLPEEDLDALVSVSTPDDLEHLMDEYEKLLERCLDGSPKLRVFLSSNSELDSPDAVQMGDFEDNGQRYVEAVNGIIDGNVPGIVRKESILSVTSTQNSDMSGGEPADSTNHGQSDVTRAQSTGELSPKSSSVASQETAPRFVCVDYNPALYVEASATPSSVQMLRSHSPATLSMQPVTIVQPQPPQQMTFDMQQQKQMGFPSPAPSPSPSPSPSPVPQLQSYVDPQHEAFNHTDYVQYSSHVGFPTRLMGNVGPMFAHQQYQDNAVNYSPHQYITATTPSSYASIKPNTVQQIGQPQHVRLERYLEENTYGQRIFQYPGDQSYNAYHTQVSPQVTSGYGWQQAPQLEPVNISEAWVPHRQVVYPEQMPRYQECYMCQKALPHAHSDTVAHGRNDSPTSSANDLNSYHSFQLDESTRYRPVNRGVVNGPMGVDMIEKQVTGSQMRVLDNMNHDTIRSQYGEVLMSANVDGQYGKDTILQRENNHDHSQPLIPQGVAGMAGGVQSSYSVITGVVPPISQETSVQKPVVQTQYKMKQEALINKAVIIDDTYGDTASQTSDIHESPQSCHSNSPGYIPKESTLETSPVYDQLKQSDGRTDKLVVRASESLLNNEPGMAAVDISRKKDIMEHRTQLIAGTDAYGDKAYSKPKVFLEARCKQNETPPCLSTEVPYSHNFQPRDSHESSQPHLVNAGHSPSRLAVNHLGADGATCGKPTALPVVELPQVTERTALLGEWNDSPSRMKPNLICSDVEPVQIEEPIISALSPASRAGDMEDNSNSLFSSQDPWSMRHEIQVRPPRPNRLLTKKEVYFGEHQFGNIGDPPTLKIAGSTIGFKPDDRVIYRSGNSNTQNSVLTNKGSGEEPIIQELNGAPASVRLSCRSSNSDSGSRHGSGSAPGASQISETQYSDVESPDSDKKEDNRSKLQDKANFGFPVSDGIGRLQIIKNSDLEELRELGSGTFGTVYHGNWRGSDVAIKRISNRCFAGKPSEQERMRDDFWNEAINLADLHHPNVVAFYGVVLDGPGDSVATVTEFMVNGSLRTALQRNEKSLDKRKRLLIAMDVAFGMEYLHGKNIVHFDLKSDNLLVNLRDPHRPICKVGDLGLSKVKCQTLISGGVRGTLPWMAPELLNGSSSLVSEKVDVFSFGVVLWELLTGDEPYADLHYGAIIGGIVSNTLRPPIPEYCDPEWKSLLERCWSTEPSERPAFSELANQLRSLAAKVPPKVHLHR